MAVKPVHTFSFLFFVAVATTVSENLVAQESVSNQEALEEDLSRRQLFATTRTTTRIDVDGDLSDAGWANAAVLPILYETSPGDNLPARVRTTCMVTFDSDNLYLACDAADPQPGDIRSFVTDRDNIDAHDRVEFTIDPFNDSRRAFRFEITPLGVQADGVFDQQSGQIDQSWDAIWSSAGRLSESGYAIEAAIPFKSLRFPSSDGVQTWGIYASRSWPRSDFVEMRSMRLDRDNSCELCQSNLVTGFEGISPGTNLEFVPTITSSRSDRRNDFPSGPVETGDVNGDPGLDVRWGVTTDFTLSATANPDFSQVEADAAQLDVNNRFALFFPEKRPFFLEGADFFSTPFQAVFTRTIVDPIGGAKGTGKIGSNAVGGLVARDESPSVLIPSNQGSATLALGSEVTSYVGRFRRDIGESSTLGGLITDREGDGYFNRVAGVDGFIRPTPSLTLQLQYLRSQTDYPDQLASDRGQRTDSFSGNAVNARAVYETSAWRFQARAEQLDSGFRADAGFIGQVDIRRLNVWGRRKIWGEEGGWFSRIFLNGGVWHEESMVGRLTEQGVWANVFYEGPMQSTVWINPSRVREYFDGAIHTLLRLNTNAEIRPTGNLGLGVRFQVGDAVDFANSRKAFRTQVRPELELRLGRHLDIAVSEDLQRFSTGGERIFTASLTELKTVYNFNTRFFFRVIAQYRNTDRNPATNINAINIDQQGFFTQFLLSYKVNPQTVAFLGYTDNRVGSTTEAFERTPLTLTGRTFFVKFGYALRP